MRGTGVERSQKVTLMEDGVLVAPAPYTAPAAYYFPSVARMSAVEISKGPASIRQGPNTTGGVLNLISRPIPDGFDGDLELTAGEDATARARLAAGDGGQRFGWLVETLQDRTEGFKQLDGGGDTGYELSDWTAKLRVQSPEGAGIYQSIELKLGRADQEGNETYVGLTQEDFDRTPYRRYAASSEDRLTTDHRQAQLRYFVVPATSLDVATTVYYNGFARNWHKLEKVGGAPIAAILDDPEAPAFNGLIDIIRGEADSEPGALAIRSNRRDYYSTGVQSVLGIRRSTGAVGHELEIGLRYHEDEEDRYQEEDSYQMLGGSMVFSAAGQPGSQANRISDARALAGFVRDSMRAGRWRIEPGVRVESVDFTVRNFGTMDPERTGLDLQTAQNSVTEVIPGVGATFEAGPRWSLFGGIHEGFAPPGPGQNEAVDPERSLNYELGTRFGQQRTHLQTVVFFNDYDNLLGTDTTSGGGAGTGDQFNGGAVDVQGLEVSFDHDFSGADAGGRSLPLRLAYTLTRGEFQTSFLTSFEDWAPAVMRGDELPYLPAHQLFGEFGWRDRHWATHLSGSWVSEMRTQAGQGPIPETESIEQHLVLDVAVERSFGRHLRALLRVRNLTDEEYLAARRPAGLRPGLPRTVLVGLGARF
jgi:Fe(3+) dicitrate transport protein